MFKFKMVDSDKCDKCGEVETIRHVLWECSRAKKVWDRVNEMLSFIESGVRIAFENIFVGFNPTNKVAETIITRVTQMILSYNRSTDINFQSLKSEMLSYTYLNMSNKSRKMKRIEISMWKNTANWCRNTV